MSRYIDADKLMLDIRLDKRPTFRGAKIPPSVKETMFAYLDSAPSIDIEPKRGEWKWISSTYDRTPCRKTYMCSCCRHEIITFDVEPWEHYCPHCGAKMDGERKESE